jgi:MFS family permease
LNEIPLRRRNQLLVAVVQVFGLAVWFSASAVLPALRGEWDLGTAAAVWMTASVQVGFVVGAVGSAVTNLADRIPPHLLLAGSAATAAAATGVLAWASTGPASALALRFITGIALAGVYPVGMKLMASWAPPQDRGMAFGILIGALTVGSAAPHLISGLESLPWRAVMLAAAGLTGLGALIAACWLRPGPLGNGARGVVRPRYAVAMFTHRVPRLVNIGYFGHMWELYALWTWLPAFVVASHLTRSGQGPSPVVLALTAFTAIGLGGVVGSLVGGWAADRYGRPVAAGAALAVSGVCCLVSPLLFMAAPPWQIVLLTVWGAAVIADSGVFSSALSESVDRRYVGTSLTTQTAVGFLLTIVTIQLVPLLAEIVTWQFAFWLLAPGPIVGLVAMRALHRTGLRPAPDTPAGEPVRPPPEVNLRPLAATESVPNPTTEGTP